MIKLWAFLSIFANIVISYKACYNSLDLIFSCNFFLEILQEFYRILCWINNQLPGKLAKLYLSIFKWLI